MKYDEQMEKEMSWQKKLKQLDQIEEAKLRAAKLG